MIHAVLREYALEHAEPKALKLTGAARHVNGGDRGLRPLTCALEGARRRTQICAVVGMIQLQGMDLSPPPRRPVDGCQRTFGRALRYISAPGLHMRARWDHGVQHGGEGCEGPGTHRAGTRRFASESSTSPLAQFTQRGGAEYTVVRDEVIHGPER